MECHGLQVSAEWAVGWRETRPLCTCCTNLLCHLSSGHVPVVPLNYSALSYESPFDRDAVETCVREVVGAVSRSVAAKRNVEFLFSGIGRLLIKNGKVKMRFYKSFLNSMDASGQLIDTLSNVSVVVCSPSSM